MIFCRAGPPGGRDPKPGENQVDPTPRREPPTAVRLGGRRGVDVSDAVVGFGAGLVQVWLEAAGRIGAQRRAALLSPHGDELTIGEIAVADHPGGGLLLTVDLGCRTRRGWSEEAWRGVVTLRASLVGGEEGARLTGFAFDGAGAGDLQAWGASLGIARLDDAVGEVLSDLLGRPLPGGWTQIGDDGRIGLVGAGRIKAVPPPPLPSADYALVASGPGLRRLLHAAGAVTLEDGAIVTAKGAGRVALRLANGRLRMEAQGEGTGPVVAWLSAWLPLQGDGAVDRGFGSVAVDALHDERFGVLWQVTTAHLGPDGLVVTASARSGRARRAHPVRLVGWSADATGGVAALDLRARDGVVVRLGLPHARAALARRALAPAVPDDGVDLPGAVVKQLADLGLLAV